MKVLRITSLLLLLLQSALIVQAQVFETENGDILFLSEAPLETIEGRSSSLVGQVNLSQNVVDFYVDMATFKTGISLRDEHLRENYIETDKYPFAEFYGKFTDLEDPKILMRAASRDSVDVKVSGNFSIHGVTKPLETTGKVIIKNNQIHLRTEFIIKLSDFNIAVPQVMFYKVSEDQKVYVTASLSRSS